MHWCVSWLLTAFAHDIVQFQAVVRIFDVILFHHPVSIVYLCAAVHVIHRDAILRLPREDYEILGYFKENLKLDIDTVNRMIEIACVDFVEKVPMETFASRSLRPIYWSPLAQWPHPWMRKGKFGVEYTAPLYQSSWSLVWRKRVLTSLSVGVAAVGVGVAIYQNEGELQDLLTQAGFM